ncbi:aggrecan protein [Spatholobus suberectus]|nr:aggrecan protein [Spatholobus suberectus]
MRTFALLCFLIGGCQLQLCYSVMATTGVSGNEVNTDGKIINEELAKSSLQEHDEEAKFKGLFPKPIPIVKPIPKQFPYLSLFQNQFQLLSLSLFQRKIKGLFRKPIPIVKPIPKPTPIVKPIPELIPVVKPIPIPVYKPIPKPVPIVKPIPIVKPVPKPIPIVKPIPKPFIVKKPIPAVEPEEFLKPKSFFEQPVPKLPLDPKFKQQLLPPLPIHKPIPTP